MDFNWKIDGKYMYDIVKLVDFYINDSVKNTNKLLNLDCDKERNKFMKIIESDTYNINRLYNILDALGFIVDSPMVDECLTKLNKHNTQLVNNTDFNQKIIYFNKINQSKLEDYQTTFINNIIKTINMTNNNELTCDEQKIITDGDINIYNIDSIIMQLHKKDRQSHIENLNKKSFSLLQNIIRKRFNAVNNKNCFQIKNDMDTIAVHNLRQFITNLLNVIDVELNKRSDIFKKAPFDYDDIILYTNKIRMPSIKTSHFVSKIFVFLKTYFGLKFDLVNDNNKWNKTVDLYEVLNNNISLGYIYFDIGINKKKSQAPLYMCLNSCYSGFGRNEVPVSCIMANVGEDISYETSRVFFSEFVQGIFNLFLKNNLGFQLLPSENTQFYELLADKLFISDEFINIMYDTTISGFNGIINEIRLLKLVKFRYQCIDSMFDMVIHMDTEIVDCEPEFIFPKIYNHLNNLFKVDNFKFSNLNPITIHKIINSSGCKYYHNIFNEIIAQNVSSIILNHNNGFEFVSTITNIGNNFVTNLKLFMNNYKTGKNLNFVIKNIDNDNYGDYTTTNGATNSFF